jgi:SAM-dependent methyltransferase
MRNILTVLKHQVDPRHRHDYLPAFGYDRLLPFYDVISRALGVPTVHRALLDFAVLDGNEDVLEVGAGTGNLSIMTLSRHPTINMVGVDPDPHAVARATRKAAGAARFDLGYGQALPYPDDAFDLALSALMVHHLDPAARTRTFAEIRRVLRPHGTLLLVDVGGDAGHPSRDRVAPRTPRSSERQGSTRSGILGQLRDAGFSDCSELARRRTRFGRVTFYRGGVDDA